MGAAKNRDTGPPQYGQIDLIGLTLFRILEELVAVRKLLEDPPGRRRSDLRGRVGSS